MTETPREFIRRRKIELSTSDIMKKINEVVNIDLEVQILEEYILQVKNNDDLSDITKRNWFEKLPLHWRYLYYMAGGILIGLLLPYI